MCRVETIVLAVVLLVECGALHMYPEIFDPARFLQRPLPLKAHSERSAYPGEAGGAESTGGFKDGEVGFVRSSSESGKGGYRHRENFHKKDGNQYGHEKQTGFGESKRTGEKAADKKEEQGRLMVHADHYRPEPTYEVTEEQSDFENPDKFKKYGGSNQKDKKKATSVVPEKKSSRQTAAGGPKDRSHHKKNDKGYESIVYHENERDSSEHGYGKRKSSGKLPDQKPAKQMAAHDVDEEGFEGNEGDDRDGNSSSERDYEHEYDENTGRESDFDDNYEGVRFDSDFERSFGSEEQGGDEESEGGKRGNGRTAARQNQDYDYDEEVDRDEVDESANEDKYRGGEDSEEEDGDDRQYEYASEADGDAQDY
ncbi:uncharacterized protein DDB_G0290685-like [Anopheles ziemanni]|uniref:uncharacterized protein DDB_G0290685-like n=1 Tax=Anopheles coustani TaxID=139045 RepID=UPI0026587371|nr:uncharacterized protein DDB_G0290685-like [Anopheles coustani]XP_058173972.1 uncharacterized protein DDB_G0290685-like [Anopheles ziemanni]